MLFFDFKRLKKYAPLVLKFRNAYFTYFFGRHSPHLFD